MNPNKKNTRDVNDEVEELLRAAQDSALLKLNINSHTVYASPSDLHPDLEQRFRDLKTGSKHGSKLKVKKESVTREMPPQPVKENEEVQEDDLLARFAALKASLPKSSPLASSSFTVTGTSNISVEDKLVDDPLGGKAHIENDEDDEVENVIKWAMDAARLDPCPDSDDEDNSSLSRDDDIEDSETSDEEDAESPRRKPKGQHN